MRRTIIAGLVLAAATVVTLLVGEALDLQIESVALLGLVVGAIITLVPDQTPARRLGAFALGFFVAVLGYFFRAAVMPDTAAGHAIAAGFIVLLCVGVFALGMGRLPFWAALLGAASWTGAFEFTYAEAPPRVVESTISTSTALLLCVAIGFLAMSLMSSERPVRRDERTYEEDSIALDDMMETAK
jgi:hypothetical protein